MTEPSPRTIARSAPVAADPDVSMTWFPRRCGGSRPTLGASVLLVCAAVTLGACTDDAPEGGADGEVPADPDDAAAVDLPEGWTTTVVEDPGLGPMRLAQPVDAVTWQVGDEEQFARLAARTSGTAWWSFWAPRLEPLEPGSSNVRSMTAGSLTAGQPPTTEPVAIQLTWSPYELDVDPDDADAIAEVFATIAAAQGSEVVDTRTVQVEDLPVAEVAEVAFVLDPDVLDREVWQRFVPDAEGQALWSVQCDGPTGAGADTGTALDEACRAAIAAFQPAG